MEKGNKGSNDFSREDLRQLAELLDRYSRGTCSPEEKEAVEQWYEGLAGERESDNIDEIAIKRQIWQELDSAVIDEKTPDDVAPRGKMYFKWAAVIVVLLLAGIYSFVRVTGTEEGISVALDAGGENVMTESNQSARPRMLVLADGSSVTLEPGSSISYADIFSDTAREVVLVGEAFFDVVHNPRHPFKVITGDVTTEVLGTSFTVRSDGVDDGVVEVNVRTGKVSVYEKEPRDQNNNGVVLTPNQKVTFFRKDRKWVTDLVDDPLPVEDDGKPVEDFIFQDESIRDVFDAISSQYHIELIVNNERIYDCPFTGDVSNMELYAMLQVICRSIRASYHVAGTRILISGDGCLSE